jgi:hypothetical protein
MKTVDTHGSFEEAIAESRGHVQEVAKALRRLIIWVPIEWSQHRECRPMTSAPSRHRGWRQLSRESRLRTYLAGAGRDLRSVPESGPCGGRVFRVRLSAWG